MIKSSYIFNSTERNYGIDLLRLVAMFMVVELHIILRGGMLLNKSGVSYHSILFLRDSCSMCVNAFALISGYVGITASYKYIRMVRLWIQTFFYSFGIMLVVAILGKYNFSYSQWASAICPIFREQYWYISGYMLLFLFIPFINHCIYTIPFETLKRNLCGIFVLLCCTTMISGVIVFSGKVFSYGYNGSWLIFCYIFGAFFRIYGIRKLMPFQIKEELILCFQKHHSLYCLIIYGISVLIIHYCPAITNMLSNIFLHRKFEFVITNYTNPICFLSGVSLLYLFKDLQIKDKCQNIIKMLSKYALGIYLFHESMPVRELCIKNKFTKFGTMPIWEALPLIFCVSIMIFMVGILCDYFRSRIFNVIVKLCS